MTNADNSGRTLFRRPKLGRPYHIHHSQPTRLAVPIQQIPNSDSSSSAKTMTMTPSRLTKRPKPLPDNQPRSDSTRPSGD